MLGGREMARGPIRSYRDLDAWQVGMKLAEACYKLTEGFPQRELYGLTSQIRRAAVSIPANIAEGHNRPRQAYLNHLSIALGSQAELETHIELAVRLGLATPEAARPVQELAEQAGRLLHGLVRSLSKTQS